MLTSIHIENYVLIDSLDLEFPGGFSVITGQTGAGKSILLGAIGLALGGRADLKAISQGADRCVIEIEFDLSGLDLSGFFEQNDIDPSDRCLLRRELHRSGRSRMFLNDSPVSAATLRSLSDRLIDVHSQHSNLLIADGAFQLGLIDSIAGNEDRLKAYKAKFRELEAARKELDALRQQAERSRSDQDYLSYQLSQLRAADIQEGESKELENELRMLENAAEIKDSLQAASALMDGDQGVCSLLKTAEDNIRSAARYINAGEIAERMHSCSIELKDLAYEIAGLNADAEADPRRIDQAQTRLDALYALMQKHHAADSDQLLAMAAELEARLRSIEGSDELIAEKEQQLQKLEAETTALADSLSESRAAAIGGIEGEMTAMLSGLGLPNGRFKIDLKKDRLKSSGQDAADFLFSANLQTPLQSAGQTASGGEISRLMLCLKALRAKSSELPTLIFDEIDTGVSGEVASKMGTIMKQMSATTQIICITHLPQIACKGSSQYVVYKTDSDKTTTGVRLLTPEERVGEIAKMLSGDKVSEAAIKNAQELLAMS